MKNHKTKLLITKSFIVFLTLVFLTAGSYANGRDGSQQSEIYATSAELSKQNNPAAASKPDASPSIETSNSASQTDALSTEATSSKDTASNSVKKTNQTLQDTTAAGKSETPSSTSTEPSSTFQANSTSPNNTTSVERPTPLLSTLQSLEVPLCPATRTATNQDGHEVHTYNGFELCYREEYEVAEWVSYTLTKEECNAIFDRSNNFRADAKITTKSASPSDYTRSGYDRGHLAPAADLEWSEEAVSDSFLMSNMTPQAPQFNRGLWKNLEEEVRYWAKTFGQVTVVTGPVLEKPAASYQTIGENKVAVPEYFYKVLLAQLGDRDNTIISIAFILPNQKCEGTIFDYQVTIDEVEERTGLDFFSPLPDSIESAVESSKDKTLWE